MTTDTNLPPPARGESFTRLRGVTLLLARLVWFALVLFTLALFAIALPLQVQGLGEGHFGVRFARNNQGQVILLTTPGLALAQAGVQSGDVLLAVNGTVIGSATPEAEIQRLLRTTKTARLDVRTPGGPIRQVTATRDSRNLAALGWDPTSYAFYLTALDAILVLSVCAMAGLILWHRSDDWFVLLILFALIQLAVRIPGELNMLFYAQPIWEGAISFVFFCGIFSMNATLALFPNGRWVPNWTRGFVILSALYAFAAVYPDSPLNRITGLSPYIAILDTFIVGIGVLAQIVRYIRFSNVQERQQTKWVVWGVTTAFAVNYAYWVAPEFNSALNDASPTAMGYQIYGLPLTYFALLLVPLTMAISISRHRLWDIDLVIRRTLVYVLLTAILAGLFAALITLSQRLFVAFMGAESDLAAIGSTLLVVAVFTPVKNSLQAFVDARIKTEDEVINQLKSFGENVHLRVAPVEALHITRALLRECLAALGARGGAVYLGQGEGAQMVHALGDWDGQCVLRVPLLSQDKTLGEILLGARRNAQVYSGDECHALEQVAQVVALAIEQDKHTAWQLS